MPNNNIPIMSLGFEMMRCCIIRYAHLRAAAMGVPSLDSETADAASMVGLTSMAKRTASLIVLYAYKGNIRQFEKAHE